MSRSLQKLTYVHGGDPGPLGQAIEAARRLMHFGLDGSGVLTVPTDERAAPSGARGQVVRMDVRRFEELNEELRTLVGNQVPCVLGHSGAESVIVVPTIGLSRSSSSLSDLRGKIRYGLARVGWNLEGDPR